MGIAIEASQHGTKLPLREHTLALRIKAVDEHGNGLEVDASGHAKRLCPGCMKLK
jgi:hypothetical protein